MMGACIVKLRTNIDVAEVGEAVEVSPREFLVKIKRCHGSSRACATLVLLRE